MRTFKFRKAIAFIVSATMALSLCPAAAFAAVNELAAGAIRTQFDPQTEEGQLPFYMEETTEGVVDQDVTAQKLTLLGSNAQVVSYDASQGSGCLLIKENNDRDGYYHLYLVGKRGVAHEFQNIDENVIDGITIEKCWTGGASTYGAEGNNSIATVSHEGSFQSLYAVKTPSGAFDVYNADTGEYFAHQLDSAPGFLGSGRAWWEAGVSYIKKDGLEGLLRADGSYLYAPKFSSMRGWINDKAGKGRMPDGKYALITPYGYGVSKDGTQIETWDDIGTLDGLYVELANYEDMRTHALVRLSDGVKRDEPFSASIYSHSNSGGTYSGGVGDDWAISHGSDYDYDNDTYSFTAMVYNDAYPDGFNVGASYSDLWDLSIYKGNPAGYVVEWCKNNDFYYHDNESGSITRTTLYNEQMEIVAEGDDSIPGAYSLEGPSTYDQPSGCYGNLVFYTNMGEDRLIRVDGPNGTILTNVVDVQAYGDKVVVRTKEKVCSIIDSETGERKFAFYTDSMQAYGGTFIKYWLNEDFNSDSDSDSDEFGLINLKANENSGVKYDWLGCVYADDAAGFAMANVHVARSSNSSEGNSGSEESSRCWINGDFEEITALGDAEADSEFSNTEILPDPATKTVLVFRGVGTDASQSYELFSYASGSVEKVTDFTVDSPRLSHYNGREWIECMESDYALAFSEYIDVAEYTHGLISRDGNLLVDPEFDYFEAPGRNLFAFSNKKFVSWDPTSGSIENVNLGFYDHTGALLASVTTPYVKSPDNADSASFICNSDIQSACPFGGDLTAVYQSAEDANVYYFYDFSEVNNAATTGHVRVTEEMLYTTDEYSDLLFNGNYNKRSMNVRGKILEQITASNTDWKYAKSYAKTMMKGWTKSLEIAWKDGIWRGGGFNGTETELYEALAQELVEAIMKGDEDSVFNNGGLVFDTVQEALDSFDGYFKTYKRYKKIYEYADTDTETIRQYSKFLEKIMTPSWEKPGNDKRYEFYQSLQTEDFYKKLGNIESALSNGMDVLDMVTTYACICRLNAEIVHSIALYVPKDSGLYLGLNNLATKIANPTVSMVAEFINNHLNDALIDLIVDEGVKEAMKSLVGIGSSALSGYVAIGSLFYYVISENIQSATLNDRLKAEFALFNASALDTAVGNYRDLIIAQNDEGKSVNFQEARKRYKLLFTAYNASLAQAVEALDKVVEADGDNPSNCAYRGKYDANKSKLTYPAYIRSCRGCAEAVWEGQVANGKVTITKYVPGKSASSFDGSYGVDVPEQLEIDGVAYPVTGISEGAFDGVEVEEVYVPSTVISIGSGAFAGAVGLTTVYISSLLEEIANDAFGENTEGVTIVGEPSDALTEFADANTGIVVEEAEKTVAEGGVALVGLQTIIVSFDSETGELTIDGLELQVTYDDGSTEVVTEGYTVDPLDAGTVIVSYGGVSIEVAVDEGTVGRPVTVRYVDAQGDDLAPADIVYVAYGAESFTISALPEIAGYQPVSSSLTIQTEDGKDEYFVAYKRVIIGDGDLTCEESITPAAGAASVFPAVSVTIEGAALVEGADYTVEYEGNVAGENGIIGVYSEEADAYYVYIIVTGKGDYAGVAYAAVAVNQAAGPEIVKGDVTGDGEVAMNDILKINSYLLGRIELTADEQQAADVTGDGEVAMNDILKINSYLLGRIDSL